MIGKSAPSQADNLSSLTILHVLHHKQALFDNIWITRLFPSINEKTLQSKYLNQYLIYKNFNKCFSSLDADSNSGWAQLDDNPWAATEDTSSISLQQSKDIEQEEITQTWPTLEDNPWSTKQSTQQNFNCFHQHLNVSQANALQHMLDINKPITVIQGPPGTGKTTVISAFISALGKQKSICIIAETNIGIINIAEKLLKEEIYNWKLLLSSEFYEW